MGNGVHIYRYAHPSAEDSLRLGVARHLPRGVRKDDYAVRGYFDLWMPILAPSKELVARFRHKEITFATFSRSYRREMNKPEARGAIELAARLSCFQPIALGCYCEDASRCHRSILWELVEAAREALPKKQLSETDGSRPARYASPACYLADFEDDFEGGSTSKSSDS